jgi:hypothetical protein
MQWLDMCYKNDMEGTMEKIKWNCHIKSVHFSGLAFTIA